MRLYFLLLFICAGSSLFGQEQDSSRFFAKKLADPADVQNSTSVYLIGKYSSIYDAEHSVSGNKYPPVFLKVKRLVAGIEAAGNVEDPYFRARIKCLNCIILTTENYLNAESTSNKTELLELINQAMNAAHETSDEYLIAYVSHIYFSIAKSYNDLPLGIMYGVYSTELYEKKFGVTQSTDYSYVAELLFQIREYDKCIEYCKKWLRIERTGSVVFVETLKMFTLNTLALSYHRQMKYDSALKYYQQALLVQQQSSKADWEGIIKGNIGQVYCLREQYDTAITLLQKDLELSMQYKYYDNAANALQWIARANTGLGNRELALNQLRSAMNLIKLLPNENYQQNIYYAAIDIYKLNGLHDSALYFSRQYQQLHDVIEKKINLSGLDVSKVRMKEIQNSFNIKRLLLERKTQLQKRNFAIIGIALLSLVIILLINRQRLKFKQKQQLLEQQNKLIEQEMSSAREQMEMFTQNIQEKTSLIERMENEMVENQASVLQQEIINNLSQLTILTDADWEKFKQLFEKIYPLFFERLKTGTPEITWAEQRMAALTRLHLTARQMASMQGISVDSVHKSRQRLRNRIGLSAEVNLEEYFSKI